MAVFLSPIGGAGWQFFDSNGDPLTGGKIYTYAAGTTTPQASYTSAAGNTSHTNPIILDSAGRVPGGEIWLLGLRYKFSIYTSVNVLIATYDNIAGAGASVVLNYTGDGTTVNYAVTSNVLNVYINGVYQNQNTYTVATSILTFTQAPPLNVIIEILEN